MGSEIARRLRWRDHPVGSKLAEDRAAMARAFALLFGMGATLVLVTVPLDSSSDRFLPGLLVPPVLAYAVVVLMLWRFDRLGLWVFETLPALGTVLASIVVASSGATELGAYALFYFWVVLAVFYFFRRRLAALHLLLVGACFTAVLVVKSTRHDPVLLWLMTMGTLTVAGVLVRLLSERMQRLVDQLANAARTDPLTGLLNRRGLTERVDIEFSRARRTDQPLAIIVCDFDHFKAVNDLLGHEAGDQMLIGFANLLRVRKRGLDAAARTGGEEFALLLPDTDAVHALTVADRIRRATMEAFAAEPVPLTLSLGVASYPQNGASATEVMRAADAAMYAAKLGGRNRAVLSAASPEAPPPPRASLRTPDTERVRTDTPPAR